MEKAIKILKNIFKYRNYAIITAFLLIVTNTVSASVLGEPVSSSTIMMGEGTYYSKNVFYSPQSGVNEQTENYIEYTPNSSMIPGVTNGYTVYGSKKPDSALSYLRDMG